MLKQTEYIKIVLFILVTLFFLGCIAKENKNSLQNITFKPTGISVDIVDNESCGQLSLRDNDKLPLISIPCNNLATENTILLNQKKEKGFTVFIPWRWESKKEYLLEIYDEERNKTEEVHLFSPIKPRVTAKLMIPYGQEEIQLHNLNIETKPSIIYVMQGSNLQFSWNLQSLSNVEEKLEINAYQKGSHLLFNKIENEITLSPYQKYYSDVFNIALPDKKQDFEIVLEIINKTSPSENLIAKTILSTNNEKFFQEKIKITYISFPSDINGKRELHKEPNTIYLEPFLKKFLYKIFEIEPRNPLIPFTNQGIYLENNTNTAVTLFIKTEVTDPKNNTDTKAFKIPSNDRENDSENISQMITIPAKNRRMALLPFYLDEKHYKINAGMYNQKISVSILGMKKYIHNIDIPIYIIESIVSYTVITLVALFTSILYLVIFMILYKKIILSITTKALTSFAFIASILISFSILIDFISTFGYLLFGPFNILFGGFFYEILHHSILSIIILKYPHTGAITITGILHYTLRATLMGQISPIDVIYAGSSWGLREFLLYFFKITSFTQKTVSSEPRKKNINYKYLMMALSLSNILITTILISIQVVFYRFNITNWYLFLSIFIATISPIIGAIFGRRINKQIDF